jgi:hypothetical protein
MAGYLTMFPDYQLDRPVGVLEFNINLCNKNTRRLISNFFHY